MLPSDGAIAAVTCQRRWLANVDRDRFARDWGSAYRCKHISAGSSTWVGMLHRRICIYSRSGTFDDFSDDVPGGTQAFTPTQCSLWCGGQQDWHAVLQPAGVLLSWSACRGRLRLLGAAISRPGLVRYRPYDGSHVPAARFRDQKPLSVSTSCYFWSQALPSRRGFRRIRDAVNLGAVIAGFADNLRKLPFMIAKS